MITAAIIND